MLSQNGQLGNPLFRIFAKKYKFAEKTRTRSRAGPCGYRTVRPSGPQREGHGDGVVVGPGEAGVEDHGALGGDVGRHQEAVHRQDVLSLVVGAVGVAAAGDGVILVQRRYQRDVQSLEGAGRDGLCPGVLLIRLAEPGGGPDRL